jgi:hypothetical protein
MGQKTEEFIYSVQSKLESKDDSNSAAKAAGVFGPILAGIITQLIPVLLNCFKPDDGAQAKQYVSNRYRKGSYRPGLVTQTARRAKEAAEKEGGLIHYDVAKEVAIATLDEIREGNESDLDEVIKGN